MELSRDQVLGYCEAEPEYIDYEIEAWGGTVRIYSLTISEMLDFESKYVGEDGKLSHRNPDFVFSVVSSCVKDKKGNPIFLESDRVFFDRQNHKIIRALFVECVRFNWGSNEDLEKN